MLFDKVKQFVQESFAKSATGKNLEHFERTVYWVQQLKPDADEIMLAAAYAHDIARAFEEINTKKTPRDFSLLNPFLLAKHQQEGARIITEFLQKIEVEPATVHRIANIILKHEVGGDDESNVIKDADSISYLEIMAPVHIAKLIIPLGKDKVRMKIDLMYERISSKHAKKLAEPFYKQAVTLLQQS